MINENDLRIGSIILGYNNTPLAIKGIRCQINGDISGEISVISANYYFMTWPIPGYRYPRDYKFGIEYRLMDLVAMPLTDKWIESFGFNQIHPLGNARARYALGAFDFTMNGNNTFVINSEPDEYNVGGQEIGEPLHYVHELQNLYHALTKKELVYREI